MTFKKGKIAIIGLGYVGLPLAVQFGKIRPVVAFDTNSKRVEDLINHNDVTNEVEKKEIASSRQLNFTNNDIDLKDCNVYIICVPTPIDDTNRPNLDPLKEASELVAKVMSKNDIIIYESTVFPGCTEEFCVPILEKFSGFKFNEEFFCGYSPERVNPGDKEYTITKIKKITSGSNPEVSVFVDELYNSIIDAGTYPASSIKVAEAAKVIENSQRDLNIAFVNELSVIFERLNLDTIEILEAAGSKWNFLPFKPGIVGGHCIGVDPYYLTYKAEQTGYNPQIILAGRRINDNMGRYIARQIIQKMMQNNIEVVNSTIGVLGITFKENCPDIRNSKVVDIINELRLWNVNVIITDPWANPTEVEQTYDITLTNLSDVKNLHSIIVAVGHSEYRSIKVETLKSLCISKNPILGDIKSIYDKKNAEDLGFGVFRL